MPSLARGPGGRRGFVLLMAARCFSAPSPADDLAKVPTETLIDQLVDLNTEVPGIDPFARYRAFFADEQSPRFIGGLTGTLTPSVMAQMRELTRRGLAVLPSLLEHLQDARPTKYVLTGIDAESLGPLGAQHPKLGA